MSRNNELEGRTFNRRSLLTWGAAASATASLGGCDGAGQATEEAAASGAAALEGGDAHIVETSIEDLQRAMTERRLSAEELVEHYLDRIRRIDRGGPAINSVLELNPDARSIAKQLDRERREHGARGPLHGIPVLLKGNIDTGDRMSSTAGSLALFGAPASRDATVAARLRAAGAVILGKTNLSEFANFRSTHSTSGWSGQGGQTRNPYIIDRNPCWSSSGSGASVAASLCAAGLGTETDGSIVCPASLNGVVGIKPTVGLTSRAGVVPISHVQDTVGPHGRTVADAAALLGVLTGVDPRDPQTAASAGRSFTDYTQFVNPDGLRGARIGVMRNTFTGYSDATDAVFEANIAAIRAAGAIVIDPADLPTADTLTTDPSETTVLVFDFKRDLNAYLATRTGIPARTLADVIAFNNANADKEMPFFLQELLELAESDPFTQADYDAALARCKQLGATDGIDAVMNQFNLDALIAPTSSPAWPTDLVNGDHFLGGSSGPAAIAGYPIVQVPAGFAFGLPLGLSFIGRAYSEPTLIRLASGFEHVTGARQAPRFEVTLPFDPDAAKNAATKSPRATLARILGAPALTPPRRRPLGL